MLLQDLDAILHYYDVTYTVPAGEYGFNEPILLPGDQADMTRILARLTILLIGADACTPHIINSVWGENEDARLALGGPCGNLSLICRRLLSLSKIAINTIYIWTTDPKLPVLKPNSRSFQYLPPTLQTILLLLHSCEKLSYNRDPVPSRRADTIIFTLQGTTRAGDPPPVANSRGHHTRGCGGGIGGRDDDGNYPGNRAVVGRGGGRDNDNDDYNDLLPSKSLSLITMLPLPPSSLLTPHASLVSALPALIRWGDDADADPVAGAPPPPLWCRRHQRIPHQPPLLTLLGKRDGAILTPGMIADDAAGGLDYAGAIVAVPDAWDGELREALEACTLTYVDTVSATPFLAAGPMIDQTPKRVIISCRSHHFSFHPFFLSMDLQTLPNHGRSFRFGEPCQTLHLPFFWGRVLKYVGGGRELEYKLTPKTLVGSLQDFLGKRRGGGH